MELVVHRAVRRLPAHGFAAHRIERATLTGLRMTRCRAGAILAARATLARRATLLPTPVACEATERAPRQWGWSLASVALMVAIVLACATLARL